MYFVSNWGKVQSHWVKPQSTTCLNQFLLRKYDTNRWIQHVQMSKETFWIFVTKWGLLFSKHDTKYWKMILVEIKVLWYQKDVRSIGDAIWIQKKCCFLNHERTFGRTYCFERCHWHQAHRHLEGEKSSLSKNKKKQLKTCLKQVGFYQSYIKSYATQV